jgi:hypothetical protein
MSCNCTTPCTSTCPSYCGCTVQVPGTCVFYQGSNLTCIDATKGDTYDSILANIDSIICNLQPPSGNTTVVTGCSSITVTPTVVGSTTTYNVCLSSATHTQINNNTSNIATLSACVDSGVLDLVSTDGSVNISVDTPSTGCGRILDLSVPAPAAPPIIDGIIYSNSTTAPANGVPGSDQVLKTSGTTISTYYAANGLNVGDEIRWKSNGQIIGNGDNADYVKFDLFDGVSGILGGNTFGNCFNTSSSSLSSWELEAIATIVNNTPGASQVLVTAKLFINSAQNGTVSNSTRNLYVVNQSILGIDLSSLEIRTKYYRNVSAALSGSNFAKQLVVEIRKSI